jgi:23S rRNA (pseudouridine1915-N3)-methyltransferase
MDKSGIDTSSEQLAEIIKTWRNKAIPACYFAVGGANGHSEKLISSAHSCIRFGSATWPHLLFRAMLAEQLYRAEMILKNHPYHNSH